MPSPSARIAGSLFAGLLIAGPLCASEGPPPPTTAAPGTLGISVPTFQPGLWEFKRTLTTNASGRPQVSSLKKCTNPTADIAQKMEALKKKSCRFTPLRQVEGRYSSSWTCPTPSGVMTFRDILTTRDATAYQDVNEVRMGSHVTQQKIEAQRLGDCNQPVVPPLIMEPARSGPAHSEPVAQSPPG